MKKRLVIIPTYNEIENIEQIIRAIFDLPYRFDILVVDDSSPDGTAKKVEKLQQLFADKLLLEVRKEKKGLGTAYLAGFQIALNLDYDYIFEMDADFSHAPKDLITLSEAADSQNADMVIGSRYVQGIGVKNWSLDRIILSYFAGIYVRFVTGMPIKDPTAGFVCYRKTVLEKINLQKVRFIGYAFQIEMKFLIWKAGYRIIELPIIFTNRKLGTSKMSIDIFKEAFLGAWTLRFNKKIK